MSAVSTGRAWRSARLLGFVLAAGCGRIGYDIPGSPDAAPSLALDGGSFDGSASAIADSSPSIDATTTLPDAAPLDLSVLVADLADLNVSDGAVRSVDLIADLASVDSAMADLAIPDLAQPADLGHPDLTMSDALACGAHLMTDPMNCAVCGNVCPASHTSTLNSGLVAYWKLDGNGQDAIGNHTLTPRAGLTFSTGRIAQGADTVGNVGGLTMPEWSDIDMNQDFTLSVWVNWKPPQAGVYTTYDGDDLWDNYGLALFRYDPYQGFGAAFNAGDLNAANRRSIIDNSGIGQPTNTWLQVVVYRSGNTVGMKVNNQGTATVDVSGITTLNSEVGTTYVGMQNAGYPWQGYFDEVGFWNRALSAAELTELYASGHGQTTPFGWLNASAGCSGGVCGFSCSVGFDDCDNNPNNACEVPASVDVNNCGGCGRQCSSDHINVSCASGACNGSCATGYVDCDGDKQSNGCETRVSGSFAPAMPSSLGATQGSVSVADFNADGKLDIATSNFDNGSVTVQLGNGDGTFQPLTSYGTGMNPQAVVTADFNSDGITDLAAANIGSDNVSILLGKGDGTFQTSLNSAGGTQPFWLTAGDFNRDGKPDIATSNYLKNQVSILIGKGNGTFVAPVSISVGPDANGIMSADFNSDGKLDLAVATSVGNTIGILLGNGDGTFRAVVNYPAGSSPYFVAGADFNGDGNLDLAAADFTGDDVGILIGNGDGSFRSPVNYSVGSFPNGIAIADLNGDSALDLVVSNTHAMTISVLSGKGDGTFATAVDYFAGNYPYPPAIADLNRDCRPDILVPDAQGDSVNVLLGQ